MADLRFTSNWMQDFTKGTENLGEVYMKMTMENPAMLMAISREAGMLAGMITALEHPREATLILANMMHHESGALKLAQTMAEAFVEYILLRERTEESL